MDTLILLLALVGELIIGLKGRPLHRSRMGAGALLGLGLVLTARAIAVPLATDAALATMLLIVPFAFMQRTSPGERRGLGGILVIVASFCLLWLGCVGVIVLLLIGGDIDTQELIPFAAVSAWAVAALCEAAYLLKHAEDTYPLDAITVLNRFRDLLLR